MAVGFGEAFNDVMFCEAQESACSIPTF